ncbi:hypothetical protein B0H16DRAFT_1726862 [Mycena metata]|uniref:Uncharacterized protein n=1 Tax=Mycena metata TaxID=1033252 RepID=A0AAD7N4F9_9AGAR|nr:hypothetical protein B0H16DRAFT_1726862 [Mycena metata]
MDYIFFMGLAGSEISELYVSYDIPCQWHKNIWERMKTFPREVHFLRGKIYCVFLIPKFHLPAHIEACNVLFSFHLTRYVGLTDGEAPERGWSVLNPLASSTMEMGPGMRRDTINDAFNDMNHKKIVDMGKWMLGKVADCVPELLTAAAELEELECSLRRLGAGEALEEWRAEVQAWEADAGAPNPFAAKVERRTVVQVRGEMAEEVQKELEEAMEKERDEDNGASEELHGMELIAMGLQLEELQRNLALDINGIGNHPSADQKTNVTERGNKLRRKISTWMDAQVLFVPHVAVLRVEEDRARKRIAATQAQPGVQVQRGCLRAYRGRVECAVDLYEHEFRLREAQAHESLDDVRHQLLLRTHLHKHKDAYVRGVKANTQVQTKIKGVEERTCRSAERYRVAYRALMGLGKHLKRTEWEAELRPLLPEDVRGMPRALFQDPERKKLLMKKGAATRRKAKDMGAEAKARMSWIWRSPGVEEAEEGGMSEALRIEWAKTRPRFLRHREQLDLLEEEMHQILQFLRWRADWWDERAGRCPQAPEDDKRRVPHVAYAPKHRAYQEGNTAYARRQAGILRKRAEQFEKTWEDVPSFMEMARAVMADMGEDGTFGDDEPVDDEGAMETDETLNDELAVAARPAAPPAPVVDVPVREDEPVEDENENDYRDV